MAVFHRQAVATFIMEEGYGQHYESMYTGSMVGAGALVFALMGYVIAKAKPRSHTVDLNPVLLATIFGEPVEAVERAITRLCDPDPNSRSSNEEGRRLLKLGKFEYFVVNHAHYRKIASKFGRRRYMADLMADRRSKASMLTDANTCSQTAKTHASVCASVQSEDRGAGEGGLPVELPRNFPATEQEAKAHAGFIGCPDEFAVKTWNKAMGRGGRDSRESPILSFRHHLQTEWTYEQERAAKSKFTDRKIQHSKPVGKRW